jgi:uncharacterized protein (DUF2336 family)
LVDALTPVLYDESSLARRLLVWMAEASAFDRADAINALARAYLHCDLAPETRLDAELAMTRALDDESPRVRRSLAEALAAAREAPRALILALAADVSAVSLPVLAQSPLLTDLDLVDCAAIGDARAQATIARRPHLPAPVAAALAEVGERPAALALIGNHSAVLATAALWRLLERFPRDPDLRARLLERPALPAALRAAIAADAAAECAADSLDPRRAERLARDARETAFVAIAAACPEAELQDLASWLRKSGHLTVGLMLRALASNATALFAHCLADMADLPARRVRGALAAPQGAAFASLYRRAAMPAHFLPAFRVAVAASAHPDPQLARTILRGVEALRDPALAPVEAMLWRLASEAARADAREMAALALLPIAPEEPAPLVLEASAPPVLALNVEPGNENHAPPILLETEIDETLAPAILAA